MSELRERIIQKVARVSDDVFGFPEGTTTLTRPDRAIIFAAAAEACRILKQGSVLAQRINGEWVDCIPIDVLDSLLSEIESGRPQASEDLGAELAAVGNDTGRRSTEAASGKDYDAALDVTIEQGALVIRIGVKTLAHACTYSDWANPYDEESGDYIRTFAIVDALEFAKDIGRAMEDEREDGSSPLTDFIDKMSQAALDDGTLGQHDEAVKIKHGETHPLETWALAATEPSTEVSSTPAASPALNETSHSASLSPDRIEEPEYGAGLAEERRQRASADTEPTR